MERTDDRLRIRNWERWQSYRKDRGQPPWIKLHRCLMRNVEWVSLSDAQRGQLVAIWLLAADHDGVIPASPTVLQKLCHMDKKPDLELLATLGFIEVRRQRGAKLTPRRRHRDRTETETETDTEKRREEKSVRASVENPNVPREQTEEIALAGFPCRGKDPPPLWSLTEKHAQELAQAYPRIDVRTEALVARQWCRDNPEKRKTRRGMSRFLNSWMSRASPGASHAQEPKGYAGLREYAKGATDGDAVGSGDSPAASLPRLPRPKPAQANGPSVHRGSG